MWGDIKANCCSLLDMFCVIEVAVGGTAQCCGRKLAKLGDFLQKKAYSLTKEIVWTYPSTLHQFLWISQLYSSGQMYTCV